MLEMPDRTQLIKCERVKSEGLIPNPPIAYSAAGRQYYLVSNVVGGVV
jgi:hypothetical protein